MKIIKKLLNKISKSCVEKNGRQSHTRISSYITLGAIILSSIIFLGIDVANLISSLSKGELYEIPNAHIALFGMVLSHHLVLLGLKKHSENQQCKYECENGITKNPKEIQKKKTNEKNK